MTDTSHYFGNDIGFSATGDDSLATGPLELEQRVMRGLLTNKEDDPFNPTYGAGLGSYIGQALTPEKYAQLESDALTVVMTEPSVQKLPLPTVSLQFSGTDMLSMTISYIYAPTGQARAISFP